jgi:lipopolysaccharide transport system ATP-binding protein
MGDIAIHVTNLGKQYRIGGQQARYRTIRDTITDAFTAPFRRMGKLLRGQASGAAELDEMIWALRNVSFDVKHGEVIGVIGRNGAGKSTLLKVLSQITEPTEGSVDIYGRVGSLLEVGTGFHAELTGRENIYLNGAILGMGREEIDRKFDEIVSFAEVEKFIDTPVKHYSTGMGLRLGFAVAAHLNTEILLVDEVLAVGDAEFQRKCLGKMKRVTGEGRTVLFVSHNMPSVEALCDWAILLDQGEIEFVGDTTETITYYLGKKHLVSQASVDLRNHPERTTNRPPIFQHLRLLNSHRQETTNFQVGEDLIFELTLEAIENRLRSSSLFLVIFDDMERPICQFVTEDMLIEPFEVDGRRIVRCYWDNCQLVPGNYSIGLALKDMGENVDRMLNITTFEVQPGDYYHTGKFKRRPSFFLPNGRWEIEAW